jgi:hypothetical protein
MYVVHALRELCLIVLAYFLLTAAINIDNLLVNRLFVGLAIVVGLLFLKSFHKDYHGTTKSPIITIGEDK